MESDLLKRINVVLLGAFALSVGGCRCGPTMTNDVVPDYQPTPTALTFSACPTVDESGNPVADVYPDSQKLTISNRNKVAGGLKLSISGAGAANFTLPTELPTGIDSLGEIEVPISFAPSTQGDVRAELTIDDENADTDNKTVALIGNGINLPAQPSLETGPQKKDGSGFWTCTQDETFEHCTLDFPDTLADQTNTLQLKIRNKGCPALKITGVEFVDYTGGPAVFSLEEPASPPSEAAPLILSAANGTEEVTFTIRFTGIDDNSGPSQFHSGAIRLLTNDPVHGDGQAQPALIGLQGNVIQPSIYVTPTSCNFSQLLPDGGYPSCGNDPPVANKASFKVTNSGATALSISSVTFVSTGTATGVDGRFSLSHDITGQTLQPLDTATVEVTNVDMPLLVTDQVKIVADIPGLGTGSGGTVLTSVISGIKPCMTTEPDNVVDFGDPADELTVKRVTIKNGTGCGTLTIQNITISQQPLFSIVDPPVPAGTTLSAGQTIEASFQYQRPPSGGQQTATVSIASNDTDFSPAKLLVLQSNAALDQIPEARLTSCSPAQLLADPQCASGASSTATYRLSDLTAPEVTFSGYNSSDDHMVAKYQFTLLRPVPNGTSLQNDGVQTTSNLAKLTLPPGAAGNNIRVQLTVFDDRGQASTPTTMLISVLQ